MDEEELDTAAALYVSMEVYDVDYETLKSIFVAGAKWAAEKLEQLEENDD